MATPENPQLPNAAELTPQQIADQIAQQQVGGEPSQPDGREYVYETETGSVFRGRTKQEVIEKMLKSTDHANKLIKQQRDELEQARVQLEQQTPYIEQFQQQQQLQQAQFDPQRYYTGWAQDPVSAETAIIEHILQQRLGVSLDQFAAQVQRAYQFAERTEPEVIAHSWMATEKTYPNFDRVAPEEAEKAATAIGTLWQEFYPNEDQSRMTPQRLEQLHAVALHRGLYQAAPQASSVEIPPQASPMPTLNTGVSGGGTGQPQQIANMTPEQLRAFIEQQQPR